MGATEFKEYIAHSNPKKQQALAGKALKDNFNNFDNKKLLSSSVNFIDSRQFEFTINISLFQLNLKACNTTQFSKKLFKVGKKF